MPANADRYDRYYQDKLWKLLPAVYRAQDSDVFDRNGPLREMVNRIGAQAAILRRGIDRLWEDQSIETCDDWVIPYLADLLATNLVSSLDARGQRIDVAKTIYYRRRSGTLGLLEELASNITGWDARTIEFFRRLGRTRHDFDPAIGNPAETSDPDAARRLQLAEGLVGKLTGSQIGGWADLRNVYGSAKAQSAFDEFSHTADFRRGRGVTGWHNIPRLGVFLWRLRSFGVEQTTPVQSKDCPGQFTFDPTGREIPLFAAAARAFGDAWVSPDEWQLPGPISLTLLAAALAAPTAEPLYAAINPTDGITVVLNSLGVFEKPGSFYNLLPASQFDFAPEQGRFSAHGALANPPFVTYHYGFSSTIGAGPYDRRVLKDEPIPQPGNLTKASGGGGDLALKLPVAGAGTAMIVDSLTYDSVQDLAAITNVTIMARNTSRPVIRLAPGTVWKMTGVQGSELFLDGLMLSGEDIVLLGSFDRVVINCCSIDPGQAGSEEQPLDIFASAIDGQELAPSNIWVEAQITSMEVRRSLTGPIRTRAGGEIENLRISDSIVQAIGTVGPDPFDPATLLNPGLLAARLRDGADPLPVFVRGSLDAPTQAALAAFQGKDNPPSALVKALSDALNAIIQGASIYTGARFSGVPLSAAVLALLKAAPAGDDLVRLNRMLLKEAYPAELLEFGDLAIHTMAGAAHLDRVTVLGPAGVHRLHASESILDGLVMVENTQDGCIRFSAWSTGSVLPRKYESVEIAPGSPLFTSRAFGQPGYGQLTRGVNGMIVSGAKGASISAGAQNGSEMGAFARELNPIKERSLLIKYEEFMPLGLVPVLIYVT